MCVVGVEGRWYRNGTQFNPRSDTQNYYLSTTGELRIQNLTETTVGYYVCVTQVDNLGCYQTADANIVLAQPGECVDIGLTVWKWIISRITHP